MPKQMKGQSFSPKVGKQPSLNRKVSGGKHFVPKPSGPARCHPHAERFQNLLAD